MSASDTETVLTSRGTAATLLGLSIYQVDQLCLAGSLRREKVGGKWYITSASLREYVDGLAAEASA